MADAGILFCQCLAAGGLAISSLYAGSKAGVHHASGTALKQAKRVNLLTDAEHTETSVKEGDWVAVGGVVACPSRPLLAFNNTEAVVIHEKLTVSRFHLFMGTHTIRSETWRDVPWGLAPSRDSPSSVFVARDAVRQAAAGSDMCSHVRDLVPSGQSGGRTVQSWGEILLSLLQGIVAQRTVTAQDVLPVGITATCVGKVAFDLSNRWTLTLHPRFGMYLFRDDVDVISTSLLSSARSFGSISLVCAGAALWLGWETYHAIEPRAPTLSELLARGMQWAVGWSWGSPGGGSTRANTQGVVSGIGVHDHDVYGRQDEEPGAISPAAGITHEADSIATRTDAACVACQERRIITALVPCGHMCLCMTCARRVAASQLHSERRCPLCRAAIREVVRTFQQHGDDER